MHCEAFKSSTNRLIVYIIPTAKSFMKKKVAVFLLEKDIF